MSDTALISDCGKYRYTLTRSPSDYHPDMPTALFIMLNPSTADAAVDDPTIRRLRGFTKSWGNAGFVVANLYAYRSPSPKDLWLADDPIGPENNLILSQLCKKHSDIVCAWGANAKQDRVDAFSKIAGLHETRLWCLGKTKAGAPRHPLYIKGDQPLMPFNIN